MNALKSRLNAHFAACAAVAATATFAVPQKADAAVVYSGLVNINVPTTTAGIYLNVVTGIFATAPAGSAGWDLNPWGSTSNSFWANNAASPNDGVVSGLGSSSTLVDNLATGTLIDGSQTYARSGSSETTGATAFVASSSSNYIGFRFFKEGDAAGTVHYGWAHFLLGATAGAQPRTLIDYAYEDQVGVGITAGAGTPAPGALALLSLAGIVGGRRRRLA